MCGIAGISKFDSTITTADISAVQLMMDSLIHRGPDDSGIYHDRRSVLGHRRLSIIDLSPAGRQPMSDEKGSIWVTYNGEIYNYKDLGSELKGLGHGFRTSTDTEVIIHGYEEWGIEGLLRRLRGMFAFAIYDGRNQSSTPKVMLARDRIGIKPVYYGYQDSAFIFSSEINALLSSGLIRKEISYHAILLFLLNGSIPPPKTVYNGISALEQGHFLVVDEKGISKKQYYDLSDAFRDASLSGIHEDEASEMVKLCLNDTIRCHLVSDVPVGAFLSGGIDSSAIVALMRDAGHNEIDTISVIFPGTAYDEGKYARAAAKTLNTRHHEIEVTANDFIRHMERIFQTMDQPTVDGINTYFVSWAAAKAGLKVAISGLGGDEIFWGYKSFRDVPVLHRLISTIYSVPFGKSISKLLFKNAISSRRAKLYSIICNGPSVGRVFSIYRGLFTKDELCNMLQPDIGREVLKESDFAISFQDCSKIPGIHNQISFLETTHYMASQLLRDTDVFSMAHSLEVRVPFVDHVLVELLAKLPAEYKFNNRMQKRLLVDTVSHKLPGDFFDRPKKGFTFPFDLWFRNELKSFVNGKIESSHLFQKPFLDKLFNGFYNGDVHWSRIWSLGVLTEWVG